MLKISKELFVESLNLIKKGFEREEKASSALDLIMDGHPVITIGDEYRQAAINLLMNAVDDNSSMIDWWLYEDVEKKITILPEHIDNHTGKYIDVKVETPEELYDYFEKWN